MPDMLSPFVLGPLAGALIGYLTNTIAVLMLFRPHGKKGPSVLGLQGLIPKRQAALAKKIGEVVGTHLVEHEDLARAFAGIDLEPMIRELLDKALGEKVRELAALPMIGAFLTEERIAGIRDGIAAAVAKDRETFLEHLEAGLEKGLDVPRIVEAKVAAFPVEKLETLVLEVARRELRAIELWGAVLGALIGLVQAFLLSGT